MFPTEDGVGGEDAVDEAVVLEELALEDCILAVGDVQENLRRAHLFQLLGCVIEGSALGADVVHDEDVLPFDQIRFSRRRILRSESAV